MVRKSGQKIPVATLLNNVAGEAERLAKQATELDDLMASVAASDSPMTPDQIIGLQGIDALRQSLEAIAIITNSAAAGLSESGNVSLLRDDLADGVNIQSVRDACLGSSAASHEVILHDITGADGIFFDPP